MNSYNFQSSVLVSRRSLTNKDADEVVIHSNTAKSPHKWSMTEHNVCVNRDNPVNADSNPDKYDLDLRFRSRHRDSIAKAKQCKLFNAWGSQTNDKYGFIPLSEMILPQENKKNSSLATIFDIHKSIV